MGAWAFGAAMGGGGAPGGSSFGGGGAVSGAAPLPVGLPRQQPGMQAPQGYKPIMPMQPPRQMMPFDPRTMSLQQQMGMGQMQSPSMFRGAPGQPNMAGSYVPSMQGMPQPTQMAPQALQGPSTSNVSPGGIAQAQLGQHSPNSIPGGAAVSWHPVSLGEITRQTNELLKHGTVKNLLENNTYFKKLYSNLPEDMKVGLLKSAALVGQPSNSQIDAQSMYPSRQMPGQRTDLVGQQPAVSSNNMTGVRSPSIVGGMAAPVSATNANTNPQTQANIGGMSTQQGADASSYTGLSPTGLDFLKKQEGYSPKAYWDYKQYSIGYGTKASGAGSTITKDQANQALLNHVNQDLPYIQDLVKVPLTQNQVDALLSFSYNLGPGVLKNSSIIKLLNQGDYTGAAKAMLQYNKAGGQVNQNLVQRRQAEMNMFLGNN